MSNPPYETRMLEMSTPQAAGLDPAGLANTRAVLERAMSDRIFPGAVALVARHGRIAMFDAMGLAATAPEPIPMTRDTIFDLASLTKAVGTTTAVMILLERGLLRLDDPVSLFVPGFAGQGKEQVRVRHLLTHASGLPEWRDLRVPGMDREGAVRYVAGLPLDFAPGTQVRYSDLGFILLMAVVEAVANQHLEVFLEEQVFAPLGMEHTRFNPPAEWRPRIAATEFRAERGEYDWGTVHDENARAMGGVSGHAGLFAPARDVAVFAQMLLNGGTYGGLRILSPATVRAMAQNRTAGLNENRTLGWSAGGEFSSSGDLMGERAFGHTGFTGTSLWIDPADDLFVVLFTNRVHFGRESTGGIIRTRALFHNAVLGALADM